jgi:hypothetical protein
MHKTISYISLSKFIAALYLTGIFFLSLAGSAVAASGSFLQTDWSGGADEDSSAAGPGDQTGWTKYYSASTTELNISTQVSLATFSSSTTQTNDDDFGAGTSATTTVSGTGASASIILDGTTSGNGADWTEIGSSMEIKEGVVSLSFDNKMWVIGGQNDSLEYLNDVWYSSDGITWVRATASADWPARDYFSGLVFDDKMWIMGGEDSAGNYLNDVWSSPDGVTWTLATSTAAWVVRGYHTSLVFDNKMWIFGGITTGSSELNDVWYSTNGADWTQAADAAQWGARKDHTSLVFDSKMWILGGSGNSGNLNDVWSSPDGITWTQATSTAAWAARSSYTSLVFDSKMWILGGSGNSGNLNDVWSSPDGITWTQATSTAAWAIRNSHASLVFDSKMWVMLGGNSSVLFGDFWSSSDGITWTQAKDYIDWSERYGHTSLVFDDKMWIMGGSEDSGNLNDVWSSPDGITWTQATSTAAWAIRNSHTSLVFDDKMWIMGGSGDSGNLNDVWYSTNGADWTQATSTAAWTARYYYTSLVFDDKMWILGGSGDSGDLNDVWYSTNGADWTQATAAAAWAARNTHTSLVFDDKMWVMGGWDSPYFNDVWFSSDGITWTQATSTAQWEPRYSPASLVFDDKMWIIGGYADLGFSDAWYSIDGITWTLATSTAAWAARESHTSLVFDDKMWILGGASDLGYANDVWYSGFTTSYHLAGTFTSSIMDSAQDSYWGVMSWSTTTSGISTNISMKVRSGSQPDLSDALDFTTCAAIISGSDISSNNCVSDGDRYIQYQASLSASDNFHTPYLNEVTIDWSSFHPSGMLTSTPYDSSSDTNLLSAITWDESLPSASTTNKFQIRTSPDNITWTNWCGPDDGDASALTCSADTYFTDNTGESIDEMFTDGSEDRWFQYRVVLQTTNTLEPAYLYEVDLSYESVTVAETKVSLPCCGVSSPPASSTANFWVSINNGSEKADTSKVILNLSGDSDLVSMAVSNFPDFRGSNEESYTQTKEWDLCQGQSPCRAGEHTVYVRLYARGASESRLVSDSIVLEEVFQKPITSMTISELQAEIFRIISQIKQLQSQMQELASFGIPGDYRFNKNLEFGQTSPDVSYLQMFLKSQGAEIYPEGIVSGWFGSLTRQAVIRFQEKYAEDILTPLGLRAGTGFIAEATRAKINAILGR